MSRPVRPYQPCPVQAKGNRQLLQAHIMHNLVIGPLGKGRVECHHRVRPGSRHTCRHGHCMLLGDAHIKETLRELTGESLQPGA